MSQLCKLLEDEAITVRRVRQLLYLECDHGADWPTWVPACNEPTDRLRTMYRPLDDMPVSDTLRSALFAWQARWEELTCPPTERHEVDPERWADFVREGHTLATRLQDEVGDRFEVRCLLDAAS